MTDKYVLVIDGNFFARRGMAHLLDEHTFQTETLAADRKILLEDMSKSFAATIRNSKDYISSVVVARDHSSWRKKIEVIRPIETRQMNDTENAYKGNRVQDQVINWDGVYGTVEEFFMAIESKLSVPMIKAHGAEGDDVMYATSRILNNNGMKCMLWSSDGDIPQLVNEHTIMYKMPKRNIYCNERFLHQFKQENVSIFDANPGSLHKQIMYSAEGEIQAVNPFAIVLMMITYGQNKDNIPPLFFWNSGGAKTRIMKPAWGHVNKALALIGHSNMPTDEQMDLLYDEEWIEKYIRALFTVTKQQRDITHTAKIFLQNRKLGYLHKDEIPAEVLQGIAQAIKQKFVGVKQDIATISDYRSVFNCFDLTEKNSIFEALLD